MMSAPRMAASTLSAISMRRPGAAIRSASFSAPARLRFQRRIS
jgi:hypothetical protein